MSVNTKVNGQLVKSAGLYSVSTPIGIADIYSTEEKEVGLWIDSKPLYQKTYNVTFSSDAYAITIPSEIDIKTIIGGVDSANKTDFIHIGYGGGSSDSVQAYRTDATTLRFQNKYYSQRPNGEITIQYTKTTDVAGSGEYVPSGDKAVHYSTEEQVIGTWIDGSTLYEKTVTPTISDINNHSYADSDFVNADMMQIVSGYYVLTNSYAKVPLNQFETSSVFTRAGVGANNSLYLYANGYTVTGNAVITVRYTKTS